MRISLFLVIITTLFLESCGRKCANDEPILEIHPKVLDYFGMYKTGNWWIYENTAKTKKDSVFIGKYDETSICNNSTWISERFRKFDLKSKFFIDRANGALDVLIQDKIALFISNLSLNDSMNFELTATTSSGELPPEIIEEVSLPNGRTYSKVLKLYTGRNEVTTIPFALVAPKIGIISFINNRDTFYLKSYKIN
jgi:hypothetical protein